MAKVFLCERSCSQACKQEVKEPPARAVQGEAPCQPASGGTSGAERSAQEKGVATTSWFLEKSKLLLKGHARKAAFLTRFA